MPMKKIKLSVFDSLMRAAATKLDVLDELYSLETPKFVDGKISLPFMGNVTTAWDWADLDPANPNDVPNLNLTVAGLILAANAEMTRGAHAWSQTESNLSALGFTNLAHHYFEEEEKVNYPAMVFGRSEKTVAGKYVVAAVYRGSSSIQDAISDIKAEPAGFVQAGINATNELRSYVKSQGLTKENTILFITGHSYGAATTSLVTIMSTDLAERDSIFGYSFATPNYKRNGLTGEGMKMFSFDSNEDVVPQVPVGPGLDKTGVCLKYDRLDYKLNDPARYERFLKLYRYFRGKDYDKDSDFAPPEYSGNRGAVRVEIDTVIVRNHMPYTYMALILSALDDETAYAYITPPTEENAKTAMLEWTMYVGEVYKLPLNTMNGKGAALRWESSDESIISISEKGMMSAKSEGDARLTASTGNGKAMTIEMHVRGE